MVIISTGLLPLDDVADSADLDRVMKSISNNAILLEVSSVSHDFMHWFHGALVEQDDKMDKNHQYINFDSVLSGIRLDSDAPDIRPDTGYPVSRIYRISGIRQICYMAHP